MKIKAKVLVSDYKKALENFREISQREFRESCKQVAKEIKQNWFHNFSNLRDYLRFIRYNEDGISELLMKKDEYAYEELSIKNYFKIKHRKISKEMIDLRINSLNKVKDEFIYVDAEVLEFVNKYIYD